MVTFEFIITVGDDDAVLLNGGLQGGYLLVKRLLGEAWEGFPSCG